MRIGKSGIALLKLKIIKPFILAIFVEHVIFSFEKLEGCVKKESSETLIQALKSSISNDFDELIENLSPLFEGGDYLIINSTIQPVHIIPFSNSDYFSNEIIASYGISEFSGLPFFPKTTYYRDTDFVIDEESKRFDFFIPMIPDTWLNQKTVENSGLTPSLGLKAHCPPSRFLRRKKARRR
jgi:hypothetical protein